MKNLVIVESPTKARTIGRFLGPDFEVIASMGHIYDLPKSKLGVDVEKNFEPQYELMPDKKKTLDQLKNEWRAQAEKNVRMELGLADIARQENVTISEEELVEHMAQTGIRNPQKAYNDKFEPEIDKWKQSKLDSVKKPGMVTEEESTAGSKQPPKVALTKDNLGDHLEEVLFRE